MTTTIKVSDELRDRLKVQAARDGLTLGAHLARLAEADERAHRLSDLKTAIAHTSGTSAALYAAEAAEWERAELADMTA
jgi:predicted DNA-binding protein